MTVALILNSQSLAEFALLIFNQITSSSMSLTLRHPEAIYIFALTIINHCFIIVTSQIASLSRQRCQSEVLLNTFKVNKFHNNFCCTPRVQNKKK